jgi:putative sigma-54 modulation protein
MPLEITVSARHMDISPALRAAADEKIGRLSRFLGGMDRAEVHFTEERNPRISAKEVCEVSMEGQGHHVRCKAAASDAFAAVDLAVEKLEHQLTKVKTKLVQRSHSPRPPAPIADLGVDEDDEELADLA